MPSFATFVGKKSSFTSVVKERSATLRTKSRCAFEPTTELHTFDIDETFPVKLQPGLPVQELLDGVVDLLNRYLAAADRSSDGIDHLDGVFRFEEHVVPGAYRENAGALGAEAVDDFGVPEILGRQHIFEAETLPKPVARKLRLDARRQIRAIRERWDSNVLAHHEGNAGIDLFLERSEIFGFDASRGL